MDIYVLIDYVIQELKNKNFKEYPLKFKHSSFSIFISLRNQKAFKDLGLTYKSYGVEIYFYQSTCRIHLYRPRTNISISKKYELFEEHYGGSKLEKLVYYSTGTDLKYPDTKEKFMKVLEKTIMNYLYEGYEEIKKFIDWKKQFNIEYEEYKNTYDEIEKLEKAIKKKITPLKEKIETLKKGIRLKKEKEYRISNKKKEALKDFKT